MEEAVEFSPAVSPDKPDCAACEFVSDGQCLIIPWHEYFDISRIFACPKVTDPDECEIRDGLYLRRLDMGEPDDISRMLEAKLAELENEVTPAISTLSDYEAPVCDQAQMPNGPRVDPEDVIYEEIEAAAGESPDSDMQLDADSEESQQICLFCALLGECDAARELYGSCRSFQKLDMDDIDPGEIRMAPVEPFDFGCESCGRHALGWCVLGVVHRDVRFLTECPLTQAEEGDDGLC